MKARDDAVMDKIRLLVTKLNVCIELMKTCKEPTRKRGRKDGVGEWTPDSTSVKHAVTRAIGCQLPLPSRARAVGAVCAVVDKFLASVEEGTALLTSLYRGGPDSSPFRCWADARVSGWTGPVAV